MTGQPPDRWSSADAYEAYVGRWSRTVATPFLAWLAVPGGRRWVDVGCGTGVLTAAILEHCAPESVVGVDPAEAFLRHARAAIDDSRATFHLGTAAETALADGGADMAVAGLVLNFVPDVAAALAEAHRIVRPGGVVAGYVWDYADGMQFIRAFWDAAVSVDPAAAALDQAARFPIAAPGPLEAAFVAAGFEDVEVRPIEVPTVFADFDDLWGPFLGGTGSAPSYLASKDPVARDAIRAALHAAVPFEADGSIRFSARAWAGKGRTSSG